MPKFSIELAKPADDVDLQALVANHPIEDGVRITLRREPSFFHAVRVQGPYNQIGVVRDSQTGRVVGCGTRSIRSAYVNGTAANLGYLGGLWLDPAVRSGTLLARGYRAFHQLHRDKKALLYLTTIHEDDREVRDLLTSGRAGLPRYDDMGRYHTLAINVGRKKRSFAGRIKVVRGSPARMQEVEDCLRRNGQQRQFYPCYLSHEFLTEAPYLRDFDVRDLFLAVDNGRVIGVVGRWNQSGFKQLIVSGYRGRLRLIRPVFNVLAKIGGYWPMPPPGAAVKHFFLSFVAIDGNDPEIFRILLREIYNDAVGAGYECFLAGFHESDPLLATAARYRHFAHRSRLYVVYWEDGAEYRESLDERVPYLELATL